MKTLKPIMLMLVIGLLTFSMSAQNKKDKKVIKDAEAAKELLLKESPSLKKYFNTAAGYVIFPNVGKGGFIVGGASGNGVLYQGGKKQGMAGVKELNIGLQAGGQALIEVIFFETSKEVKHFKEGNFAFDAGVSAVALKSGETFDAKYDDGVAVFTHTKGGLMAEASVGGQKFDFKAF
ncbi:lipid-binding SYLF domain-containing protein [Aegicerativicinus sediminis]